jgi:hypothetical protein
MVHETSEIVLNDETRRQEIVDFISIHQGCSKEFLISEVTSSSKKTVYKILDELKSEKIVRMYKDKPNSRNFKLYVDTNNPLVVVPKELDEFEKIYFKLVKKVRHLFAERGDQSYADSRKDADRYSLVMNILLIYEDYLRLYTAHSLISWPKIIKDGETLSRLYTILFLRLSRIQARLSESLPVIESRGHSSTEIPVIKNIALRSLVFLKHLQPTFEDCKKYNILREAEGVADIMWKIGFDLFSLCYKDFTQYKVNEVKHWRELFKLQSMHQDLAEKIGVTDSGFLISRKGKEKSKGIE